MRYPILLSSVLVALNLVACGGDSEPAKSAADADASEHAAEHSEDKAEKAEEKADKAADKADAAADEAKKANEP